MSKISNSLHHIAFFPDGNRTGLQVKIGSSTNQSPAEICKLLQQSPLFTDHYTIRVEWEVFIVQDKVTNVTYNCPTNSPWGLSYFMGFQRIKESVVWSIQQWVRHITTWALSLENLDKRPIPELNIILQLLDTNMQPFAESLRKQGYTLWVYGNPHEFQSIISHRSLSPCWITDHGKKSFLLQPSGDKSVNIGVAYSGMDEIARIIQRTASWNQWTFNPLCLSDKADLWHAWPIDLIIRTWWHMRMSDYQPILGKDAEWRFLNTPWIDFTEWEFSSTLQSYWNADRKFWA